MNKSCENKTSMYKHTHIYQNIAKFENLNWSNFLSNFCMLLFHLFVCLKFRYFFLNKENLEIKNPINQEEEDYRRINRKIYISTQKCQQVSQLARRHSCPETSTIIPQITKSPSPKILILPTSTQTLCSTTLPSQITPPV